MFKLRTLLTCTLFIALVGSTQSAPLDSPGTVYIDGSPCNRACQSYMAWSRRLLSQQAAPVSSPAAPSQLAQPSRTKAQRTTKLRESTPTKVAPARLAKKAAPKSLEAPPVTTSDPQTVKHEEAKPAPAVKADSSPVPNPTPGLEVGTTPDQVATAPTGKDLTTATGSPAPEKSPESGTEPSSPSAAVAPELAQPNNAEQLVAILLVRPEIKSVSDLANEVVAIDVSSSNSVASVRSAIVAAGASEVKISEGETLALVRVIDGEVPAAVRSLLSAEAAKAWDAGVTGFNVLRIPLSPPSNKGGRG